MVIEAQARMVGLMVELRDRHPDARVALFSHGDPIRAAIAYFLGSPLDLFRRIQVDVASVSVIGLDREGPVLIGLNDTGVTEGR
jgi:probable phosphoglycerate mutase